MKMMMNNKLPKGWVECLLNDVLLSLESGSRPKGGVRTIRSGIPSIGGEHLTYSGTFNLKNIKFVPIDFAKFMNKGRIEPNDILIVKDGATTGKTVFVDERFPLKNAVVNEHVFICRASSYINRKYLFWFLWSESGQERILKNFKGSAQGGINKTFIQNTLIPLAPYNQQNKIVEKIDNLMLRVENSSTRLKKIPSIIKVFTQKVINAAASGELLRESSLTWTSSYIKNVLSEKAKNGYSAKPVNYATEYKVLSLASTTSGIFNESHFKFFDEIIPTESHFWLKPNDILVQRGNTLEYVGVSSIYDGEPNKFIYPDLMIKLKANENIILPKFLYYLLSSDISRNYLRERATGTSGSMPKINQPVLLNLPIKFPPIVIQKEIIQKVDELLSYTNMIEEHYRSIKYFLDKLTNSILSIAYQGKLVKQSSNNGNDNADLLLRKILNEKYELSLIPTKKLYRTTKSYLLMEENTNLLKILKENGGSLSPLDLWKQSGFAEDIDAFYNALKQEVELRKTIVQQNDKTLIINNNENRSS